MMTSHATSSRYRSPPPAMDATLLGVVLESSVLIAAERRKLTPAQAVESLQHIVGEVPIVLCALTIAEIGHGIYRAATEEMRSRRRVCDIEVERGVSNQSPDRKGGVAAHAPTVRETRTRSWPRPATRRSHHRCHRRGTRIRGRHQQLA